MNLNTDKLPGRLTLIEKIHPLDIFGTVPGTILDLNFLSSNLLHMNLLDFDTDPLWINFQVNIWVLCCFIATL